MTKLDIKELQKARDQKSEHDSPQHNPRGIDNKGSIRVEQDLVISHIADAPRDLVWKTLTEPEHLKHWWGPKGFIMQNLTLDLRPGGIFHYSMMSPEEKVIWGKFVYEEIDPMKKLVFVNSFSDEKKGITRHPMSATWPLEVFNTLTLSEHSGRTTIMIIGHPINATETELQTFNDGQESMQKGFEGTWEQLDLYLEKIQYVPNVPNMDLEESTILPKQPV